MVKKAKKSRSRGTKQTDAVVAKLAAQVAKSAGVDAAMTEKVLRALNVTSHIDEVSALSGGRVDSKKIKLAYRISSGGIIA